MAILASSDPPPRKREKRDERGDANSVVPSGLNQLIGIMERHKETEESALAGSSFGI